MRTVRRAVTVTAAAFVVVQLLLAAAVLSAHATDHRLLAITGGSMEPRYSTGDVVWLDVRPDAAATGDVVTFRNRTGDLVTHRVVSTHDVDGSVHLRTQGDANNAPDPDLVPADMVVGQPRWGIPGGGYAVTFLLSPGGMLLTYGPALTLILIAQVLAIVQIARALRLAAPAPVTPASRPGRHRRA